MSKQVSKSESNRVTIKYRAEAKVCISVRSDGQLVLKIEDDTGVYRQTGHAAEIGGAILGWMIGDKDGEA